MLGVISLEKICYTYITEGLILRLILTEHAKDNKISVIKIILGIGLMNRREREEG